MLIVCMFSSMEIGSAYALQVCLLQIPAMVAFSAWYDPVNMGESAKTFRYVDIVFYYYYFPMKRFFFFKNKFDLPEMGCYCHNPLHVLDDLYLHRSQEQLSPWKYSHPKVNPFFFRLNKYMGTGLNCFVAQL